MPSLSTDVDIDFTVYCNKCNTGLCSRTYVNGSKVSIDPCPKCAESDDKLKEKMNITEEEVDNLKDYIVELEQRLIELGYYPTIPEIENGNWIKVHDWLGHKKKKNKKQK